MTYSIPHLEKTKGNVVNVSSIAGQKTYPTLPYYGALKAALDHWTKNMAALFGPKGVRFNVVSPGPVKTFIAERNGLTGEHLKNLYKWCSGTTALQRVGESPEMSSIIRFLASDDASYMTGAVLVADGGTMVYAPPMPAK